MTRKFQSTSDLNDEKDRDERRTHNYEDVAALPIVIARLCDFECNRCTRSPIVTTSPMVIALHSTASEGLLRVPLRHSDDVSNRVGKEV